MYVQISYFCVLRPQNIFFKSVQIFTSMLRHLRLLRHIRSCWFPDVQSSNVEYINVKCVPASEGGVMRSGISIDMLSKYTQEARTVIMGCSHLRDDWMTMVTINDLSFNNHTSNHRIAFIDNNNVGHLNRCRAGIDVIWV